MKKILRIILFLVNLLFALALILSTLAGWIPPSKSAKISLLSYTYPFLLLANIVWMTVWLCFSRREFLVSLIAILLRYSFLPLFFQMGGTVDWVPADTVSENVPNTLKLMTYNVHGFKGMDETMAPDSATRIFCDLLRQEQPDVMTIQEFYVTNKSKWIDTLEAMGYRYHYGSKNRLYGVQILSKYPFDYVCSLKGTNKIYADVVKDGVTVRVFCLHLDSYQLSEAEKEQVTSLLRKDSISMSVIEKLRSTALEHEKEWQEVLKDYVVDSPYPLVVAGDYNDTPASYIYQQFSKYLKDAYTEQGCGFCTTYHGMFPSYRIDHVFHSETLTALSYKRIKNDLSDHYPVVVTLQLPSH